MMMKLGEATRGALGLGLWLGLVFLAASVGAQFRPDVWYAQINKPFWTPPGYLFAPVWTTLYIMMAISAWLVWRQGGFGRQALPLSFFLVQLFFNGIWSWLFFGLHSPGLGLIDIVCLWATLVVTLVLFFRAYPVTGWLLVPYLGWVTFAGALNFTIWRIN